MPDPMLAYESTGHGVPVVLVHGLTFDRRSWAPIVDRLGGDLWCIAVDLPGHGDSGGSALPMDALAAVLRRQLDALGAERPVVVGHSMFGGLAMMYAAQHPVRGAVTVDSALDVRRFAALVRQLEPALRSDAFAQTFDRIFQASMGLDLLADDVRATVLAGQRVDRELVLGYWTELLATDPEVLQARIDGLAASASAPMLAVFGREPAPSDRERLARLPDAEIEVWDGCGHFVHLAAPDRFCDRLRAFVARTANAPPVAAAPHATAR